MTTSKITSILFFLATLFSCTKTKDFKPARPAEIMGSPMEAVVISPLIKEYKYAATPVVVYETYQKAGQLFLQFKLDKNEIQAQEYVAYVGSNTVEIKVTDLVGIEYYSFYMNPMLTVPLYNLKVNKALPIDKLYPPGTIGIGTPATIKQCMQSTLNICSKSPICALAFSAFNKAMSFGWALECTRRAIFWIKK